MSTVMEIPKEQCPYKRYGAAVTAWRTRRREVLMAGPAGTGKSRALLEKLHYCADKYEGIRGLMVRKTRKSITQSTMVTFEKKVLPAGCLGRDVIWRTQEQEYRYPNGSIIAVAGLDDPAKVMSSEWDIIYVQEATELSEEDWGALTTRLRNGNMPYQQLVGDCNPGPPTHWIKQKADRGELLMLESRHEDNPTVTPEYLASLDKLPGVLRDRLRYGRWAAAEGMVYEEWNPAIHVLARKKMRELGIFSEGDKLNRQVVRRVLASVDWGFTNPGAIQVYALDGDNRAYMVRELYRTQRDIDWWIAQGKELKQEFGIEQFVCDPAEPAYIDQFNKHQLYAIKAINSIPLGISAAHARLKVADDGRPRFSVYEYALRERDESRVAAHRPFGFTMEIDSYAYPKNKDGAPVKEVPVKVDDHAMDAFRYFCLHMADPTPTSQDHQRDMDRRVALAQQRNAAPTQDNPIPRMLPQKQKAWWE